jgi:hypothetical protein
MPHRFGTGSSPSQLPRRGTRPTACQPTWPVWADQTRFSEGMICERPGLPKKCHNPWSLTTNLQGRAESLCQLYATRMSVEERIRDQENRRTGWALRRTRIHHAERFERLLLILALAYLSLSGLGLQAKLDFEPSQRRTNTRNRASSVFTIGEALLGRWNYDPDELLRRVRYATEDGASRWG